LFQPDRFREDSAGDEREGHRRGLVEPLRVVDHPEQRLFLGDRGEQAEHAETHDEAIRGRGGAQPERRRDRVTLGPGSRSRSSTKDAHSWWRPA
jgi:hypothetical protein